jgi:hypothetical protein
VISSSADYALARFVGHTALNWFIIDRDIGNQPSAA